MVTLPKLGLAAPLIDALAARIAILDSDLRPIAANRAWIDVWSGNFPTDTSEALPQLLSDVPDPQSVAKGVRDVLEGRREVFRMEYSANSSQHDTRRIVVKPLRENGKVCVLVINESIVQERSDLHFEKLLTELLAAFLRVSSHEIDSEIEKWLQRVVLELGLDRSTVGQVDPTDGTLIATHQWSRESVPSVPHRLKSIEVLPWLTSKIMAGEVVVLDDLRDAPPEAWKDLEFAAVIGTKATLSVPLKVGGEIVGVVVYDSVLDGRKWTAETIQQLRRVTEIFGIALERQQSGAVIRNLLEEMRNVLRTIPMAEVTTSLAHELNQPLGAILNNAQAARRLLDRKKLDMEDLRAAMEEIIRDVARATETVQHTREIFQSITEEKKLLKLDQVLIDVERMVRNDAKARGISIRLNLPPSLPAVMASRQGMIQVLMNLILNAFDSIDERTHGLREIEISAEHKSSEVHVRVRDSGKGIDSEIMPRLFNAFFTTKSNGTGVGLAIARSILEKSGGLIWAKQNPGPGATIEFTLPV